MAGLDCYGVELDPIAHYLGSLVGSGKTQLGNVLEYDYSAFPAVWASPPCQTHSRARTQGDPVGPYATDLLPWALSLPNPCLWVENVDNGDKWGTLYNATQFAEPPLQCRNRRIGGRYPEPATFRPYSRYIPGVCPAITATEYKGCATDTRRASRFFGRKATLAECATAQGFTIPPIWYKVPPGFTQRTWHERLYRAIGNGVPVYMAYAFGKALIDAIERP